MATTRKRPPVTKAKANSGVWSWLKDASNQKVLGWIGGGVVVVSGGLWKVYLDDADRKEASKKAAATADAGKGASAAAAESHATSKQVAEAADGGLAINAGRDANVGTSAMAPSASGVDAAVVAPRNQEAKAGTKGVAINAGRDVNSK